MGIDRSESNEGRSMSVDRLRNVGIYIGLVGAGLVTFHTYDIDIASDMAQYMSYALNMIQGNGYVDFDGEMSLRRGPVFPLMISWCYWLLGVSPWSAFWAVRVFCVLNPVVVYALGKALFSGRVGVTASILVLTSYSVSFSSYRHLDAVWSFFTLTSILCLYKGLARERLGYWVLSGLLAATSFLVKESALLFFPLPIILLAVIPGFRSRKNVSCALIWCVVVLAGIAPWLYFIHQHSETEISGLGKVTRILGSNVEPAQLVTFYLRGLLDYYAGHPSQPGGTYAGGLSSWFSVSALFLIAWGFALLRSLREHRGSRVLVVCLVLLSPYMAYAGQYALRPGQLVILFLLSYLVLGYFLCSLAEWLAVRLPVTSAGARRRAVAYAVVLVVSPIILFQSFAQRNEDRGGLKFLRRSLYANYFRQGEVGPRRVTGVIGPPLYAVTKWLEETVPSDAVIMGGSFWENRGLFVISKGRLKLQDFPLMRLRYLVSDTYRPWIRWENERYSVEQFDFPPPDDLLFFSTHADSSVSILDWANLWILYESHALQKIVERNVEYVFVGPVFNFLAKYFEASDAFVRIASFRKGRFQVFKVEPDLLPSAHRISVTRRTTACLGSLRSEDSASFDFLRSFLTDRVGLERSDVDGVVSGQLSDRFESARFKRKASLRRLFQLLRFIEEQRVERGLRPSRPVGQ